jgi:hypothetical protein
VQAAALGELPERGLGGSCLITPRDIAGLQSSCDAVTDSALP